MFAVFTANLSIPSWPVSVSVKQTFLTHVITHQALVQQGPTSPGWFADIKLLSSKPRPLISTFIGPWPRVQPGACGLD